MCGRFTNMYTWKQIHDQLRGFLDSMEAPERGTPEWEEWDGNVNVAPTTRIPILRHVDGTTRLDLARWGFIAPWAETMQEAAKWSMFNARGEELEEKKSYVGAWKAGRRCIIPANSFFEWKKLDKSKKPKKQAYAIGMGNKGVMSIGGLWQECKNHDTGEKVLCVTIITTKPNTLMEDIHDRMPVIVGDDNVPMWLGEEKAPPEKIKKLLEPIAASRMTAWPVSNDVGQVANKEPRLLERIAV
jgi:putative SOS response-associated peptidase YedK